MIRGFSKVALLVFALSSGAALAARQPSSLQQSPIRTRRGLWNALAVVRNISSAVLERALSMRQ